MTSTYELTQVGAFIAGVLTTLMFVILFSITSSSDRVYYKHINQAQEVCENNDGLVLIKGHPGGAHQFVCANGARFFYDEDRD